MRRQERLPLGIVVERREVDNPWIDHVWTPVAVIPGAGPMAPTDAWTKLSEGGGRVQFHAGTLTLELFARETEGYKVNLSQQPPQLFVILRAGADTGCDHEVVPFRVTACPYEAQDYLDSGEDLVEAVAMPDGVVAFVQAYVDRFHVDEPFHKRKRKRWGSSSDRGIAHRSSSKPDA